MENNNKRESERKPRLSASMITAIAAGIVSLSALGVSIYEAYLMREQQAASVLPIIDFWSAYGPESGYSLNLANKGLGPAFIKDISVTVDGKEQNHWTAVTRAITGQPVPHGESALIGSVLAPGDAGALITIPDPERGTEIWRQAMRMSMQVCYCSVFKNCWLTDVADLNTGTPRTLEADACPEPTGKGF
jgi:hypothetical protein